MRVRRTLARSQNVELGLKKTKNNNNNNKTTNYYNQRMTNLVLNGS